jgi:hypothetical protein
VNTEWRGGPEADARGGGGGRSGRLRWPVAGPRCVSSARLRCARALWTVANFDEKSRHNGEEGRKPTPGGRGQSEWAAARGCAGRWPGHGACPRLGFAARGRCGPSPGVLRGRIYFAGLGARRRARHTSCRGDCTSDSKTLPEYSRDPHAMERNAHTACCVRV